MRGTVAARVWGDAEWVALWLDPGCAFHASCDVRAEREGTVVNPSCPNGSDC